MRWHLQHQRIQDEVYQITAMRDQLSQLSTAMQMVGGEAQPEPAAPLDDEDDF